MFSQEVLINNEAFSLKSIRPAKSFSYYIDVPLVEASTQVCYNLFFTPMALCVPLPSSDIVEIPPKFYVTHLEYPIVVYFNYLMTINGLEKMFHRGRKETHPLQRHP